MSDYLLISGVGLGGWAWGKVWGHLTAPVEHPPRLDRASSVGKVVSIDLAGSSENGAAPRLPQEESIGAISRVSEVNGLRDLVLVGHDIAAPLVLRAAADMERPPKRIVLVGGIIPVEGKPPLSVLSPPLRLAFTLLTMFNEAKSRGFKLPKSFISGVLCSELDPTDVIQVVGLFQPVPVRVLQERVSLRNIQPPCPISFVVLTQDRLISQRLQRRMALRLGLAGIDELDACHAAMLHRPKELADILLRYA